MIYFLVALGGFIVGFVVSFLRSRNAANGTLIKVGEIWRLEVNDPIDKLDKKKRIIFNVSNDKEV